MEKRLALTTGAKDEGVPLGQFLRQSMGLSKKEISRAKFLENGICVDGERRKVTALLKPGQLVEVSLELGGAASPQLSSSKRDIEILYEDEDVIVLNKPAGLSVHPSGKRSLEGDTLANRLAYYLREKQEDCVIRIFGRLDKDTSGVVLAAKNRTAAARLERQRQEGYLKKTYLAVCQGVPKKTEGTICVPLAVSKEDRRRMCVSPEGKYARTHYQVLKSWASVSYSLIRLHLDTGRMHQIRVHMASIGCPLLGDPLYGEGPWKPGRTEKNESEPPGSELCGEASEISRTALHAEQLVFRQPFTGEALRILAPVPKDIARLLGDVLE